MKFGEALLQKFLEGSEIKIYLIYFSNTHQITSIIADYIYINHRHKLTKHGYEYTYRRFRIEEICNYLNIENNKSTQQLILRSQNIISNKMMKLNSPFPLFIVSKTQ